MPNHRSNGRPADCPVWAWVLIQEVRESNRQAADDRKQAAGDRGQMLQLYSAVVQLQQQLFAHIVRNGEVQKEMAVEQKKQTRTLDEILRTLRVQGNGRGGNGRRNA